MSLKPFRLDQDTYDKLGLTPHCKLPLPLSLSLSGKTMVLAGENGAGKTRLLNLLVELLDKQLDSSALEDKRRLLRRRLDTLNMANEELLRKDNELVFAPDSQALLDQKKEIELRIGRFEAEIVNLQKDIKVATLLSEEKHAVVRLVPIKAKLEGRGQESDHVLAEKLKVPGCENSEKTSPSYLLRIKQNALAARDVRRDRSSEVLTLAEQEDKKLDELLELLLGSDVAVKLEEAAFLRINGLDVSENILSPGQQILFQFGCILHAQGGTLSNCIVIMDEPENHLHPAALQEVVDKIISLLKNGKLWIGTHSVPLIAHLIAEEPNCLWFAEGGKFSQGGITPTRVLKSLMGTKKEGKGAENDK